MSTFGVAKLEHIWWSHFEIFVTKVNKPFATKRHKWNDLIHIIINIIIFF